jgi:hypothetical protein
MGSRFFRLGCAFGGAVTALSFGVLFGRALTTAFGTAAGGGGVDFCRIS